MLRTRNVRKAHASGVGLWRGEARNAKNEALSIPRHLSSRVKARLLLLFGLGGPGLGAERVGVVAAPLGRGIAQRRVNVAGFQVV